MSASQVELSLANLGVFHLPSVDSKAAAKASKVLQENHDSHHIFFNQSGFHSMCLPGLFPNNLTSISTLQ